MKAEDYDALVRRLKDELCALSAADSVALIGRTATALDLASVFVATGALPQLAGTYAVGGSDEAQVPLGTPKAMARLRSDNPVVVVIASDEDKEALLEAALPYLRPETRILIGGFAHFGFRDVIFQEEAANPLVPSLANGYPNSLIHIFQCLRNAARLDLKGIVVEFGMFKGGTTMLISRFIERLGKAWKVYGFDSFGGFPAPRSPLDMYAHHDCVFTDEPAVRRYFSGRNVEIVAGDIVETASRMRGEDIILAFVDTDNYSSAIAVLDAIQDGVVPGGAIIFDHFTGRDRFLYTLGERIAAKRLLADSRYLNLHDTGVFLRQR